MTFIGIDPGSKGAVAMIKDGGTTFTDCLPYDGRKSLDVHRLKDLLTVDGDCRIFVEKPMLLARQGGSLTTGTNYGRILATIELMRLPYREVSPQTWVSKLLGKTGGDKGFALAKVKQLFPNAELILPRCKVPHDGIVDALLIAEWGRRHG
jgi:hypothetical protein